jgi:hypothetical protein
MSIQPPTSHGEPRRPGCERLPRGGSRAAPWLLGLATCASAGLGGCGDADVRRLDPLSVGLTDTTPAIYSDGELTIYQARTGLGLPIIAPSREGLEALREEPTPPFERRPWVTHEDVEIQLTWTLSNLDPEPHEVWVMLDPWNEFGRYEPAIVISDEQAVRDLSGIDMLFLLPGVMGDTAGAPDSRIVGTFTFDDMDELAIDFATVFQILSTPAPADVTEEDPRSALVNNAFNVRNRSYDSPLLSAYRPRVIPGLIGFDFGVRTSEPANVALEILVEMRDRRGDRIAERGESVRLLDRPETVLSAGTP